MQLWGPKEQLDIWHIPVTPPKPLPELTQPSPNSRPGLERAEAACGHPEGSSLPGRLCQCHCKTHPKCIAVKNPPLADFTCGFCDSGCIHLKTFMPQHALIETVALLPALPEPLPSSHLSHLPASSKRKETETPAPAGRANKCPLHELIWWANAELFKWEKGKDCRWMKCLTAHRDGTDSRGLFLSCREKEEPCEGEEKRVWLVVPLAVWDAVMATIKAALRFSWRETVMLQFTDWFCEKGCQAPTVWGRLKANVPWSPLLPYLTRELPMMPLP